MINPCNGEGIAYGYETGRIAGRHIDEALRSGSSPELDGYSEELKEVYGPYYRLGRRFVRLIGNPVVMDRFVSVGMMSRSAMSFALTFLGNLEDVRSKRSHQFGLRALKHLSEMKP
jgi:flavin-dependent dehydrogenase